MKDIFTPKIIRVIFFLTFIVLSSGLLAQSISIKGKVTDQNGESLPGVNIQIQGSTSGAITDFNGDYTLSVAPDAVLIYSFIGYVKQTVSVNGRETINITLLDDVVQMNEIVVVGYGVVDKKDLTGSVSVLSSEDLELQPVVRLESALQSKVAGVVVNQNSGNPGAGLKVRIRGTNSFGGGNDPLYVIDGYIGADIQSINPSDITSISVLKDASATALYGSQGANGVIIISTKQSKSADKPQLEVSYQHGISILRTRWDLMEGWQYMQTINDKMKAGGTPDANLLFSKVEILNAQSNGLGTDWQDVVFQPGSQDQVQLSVTKGAVFLSGAVQTNKGIVTGTEYNRYNFRMNYSEDIFKPVKLFMSVSNAFEDRKNADDDEHIDIIRAAVGWPVNLPVMDPVTGDYTRNQSYGPLSVNPAFSLYESPGRTLRNDLLTNSFLEFKLLPGLKFKTLVAFNLRGISSTSFTRVSPNLVSSSPENSSYGNNNQMVFRWQTTQQLTYQKEVGEHKFDATAIYEARSEVSRGFNAGGNQLTTTDLGYYSAPVATIQTNGSSKQNTELWSYFGRLNYTYRDRYLATLNVRHDESSRLGVGYQGATFFGGALAYKINEELFMQNIEMIDELKLRVSLGQVGSQAVGFLETIETVGYNRGYSFDGSTFDRGANLPTPKNSRLTWETTNQLDAGFDLSILDGRLNLIFDSFFKRTTGLIFNQQVPAYAGGGTIKVNAGEMQNKGVEITLSGYAIDKDDLTLEIAANIATVRNKLVEIVGASDFIVSGLNQRDNPDLQDNTHRNFVGQPLGLLWGYIYDGVYSTDQADEADQYNRSPGDPIYRDLNQDGKIDNADMTVIGNPNPDFTWGLTTNLKYKNFTVNLVWGGVQGVDILNSLKYSTYGGQRDATNIDVFNRWTPTNQNSNIPGFTTTSVLYRQSTQWIEDGSYVKLRNATVKYDIPMAKLDWLKGFKSVSVFLTAQNALVFTKYTGYDPESLSNTGDRAGGFDEGGYPIPRTFLSGVNFRF